MGIEGRIFVTGATGFIGARVVQFLLDREHQVAVLLRKPGVARRIAALMPRLDVVEGDLFDLASYARQLELLAPAHIIHLGWAGVAGASRNEALQYRNVMAFVDLMDLALRLGVHHFVGLGSQAEYGTHSGRLNETALVRPTTLYGAAKLASYVLAERRLALASLPFAWIRVFSTFGPDDDPGTMISYLTSALLKRERPRLTAGEQKWDYLYVDDAARAIIAVVEAHATGVFNLGSGYAHRLRHVIETVRDLIDPSLPLGFGELAYRQDQVMHLEADITKLKNSTGWVPRYSLEEGLALTVNWMRGIFL